MRGWIRSIQQTIGITTIYVTHDQTGALTMSDRIGVMRSGRLLQTGTPRELYDDPSDVQVASFLGTATLLEGAVQEAGPEFVSMTVAGRTLQGRVPTRADIRDQLLPGAACSLVLRAEQLDLVRDGGLHSVSSEMQELPCRVRVAAFEGPALSYATEVAGVDPDILVSAPARGGNAIFAAGESAVIRWPTAAAVVLPGRIHT
jgi:ABC-type Fe3+/spermidine/putrescine transport system ATPase subunit